MAVIEDESIKAKRLFRRTGIGGIAVKQDEESFASYRRFVFSCKKSSNVREILK